MTKAGDFLIPDVARLLRRSFDERARAIGVTRPQWRVLTALSRQEGVNQGVLADFLDVEPITLCRMVDRLQDAGLVERRSDPADRRAWQLYLTDKARPILAELRLVGEALYNDAHAGFSVPEKATLDMLLDRVRVNLTRRSDTPHHQESKSHG